MGFFNRIAGKLQSFMRSRYGADQLSYALSYTVVPLLLLGLVPGLRFVIYIAYALMLWSIFRMLSKNPAARRRENQWYLDKSAPVVRYVRQAKARFKNRREYRYFRCPKCRSILKLKRGAGEGTVTCGKCGSQFRKKA